MSEMNREVERNPKEEKSLIKTRVLSCVAILFLAATLPSYSQQAHPLALNSKPSPQLIVSPVGSVPGVNGTFFRTDLTVLNHRDTAQTVHLVFVKVGDEQAEGFRGAGATITLEPRSSRTFVDVVSTLFNTGGIGYILIDAITTPGGSDDGADPDPAGLLHATSRIWTTQPRRSGTTSQSSTAVDRLSLPPGRQTRLVVGARQDEDFRTNVGVVNLSASPRSFRLAGRNGAKSVTSTLTVPAFSLRQVALPSGRIGYMTVIVEPLDASDEDPWTAYASSVDNGSGDSWIGDAQPRGSARYDGKRDLSPHAVSPGPGTILVIPVAGSVQGASGTYFRTDVTIVNHRDVEQKVPFSFNGAGTDNYYGGTSTERTVPAYSTKTFEDVADSLFMSQLIPGNTSGLGSMFVNWDTDTVSDPNAKLDVSYRIWTPQPGGPGTTSQSSAAVDLATLPKGTISRVIVGVRQDPGFRMNVGVLNITSRPTSYRVTARSPLGSVSTDVGAFAYSLTQVPLPPGDLGYVTLTIEPIGALDEDQWMAYATSVDNDSGDSWIQNALAW